MSKFLTSGYSLKAAGAGVPLPLFPPAQNGLFSVGYLEPAILVQLSSGASLTYSIEVTGDDTQIPTYIEANGVWVPFTNMTGLTASNAGTIGACVKAIRANITAYTSGTLTLQLVQLQNFGG